MIARLAPVVLSLLASACALAQPAAILKRNDRVLWLGDARALSQDALVAVESALLMLRPGEGLRFDQCAIDRADAEWAAEQTSRSMFAFGPSVVFVFVGFEDGGLLRAPMPPGFDPPTDEQIDEALDAFEDALSTAIRNALERLAREVVVVGPPAPDELEPDSAGIYVGYSDMLRRISERAASTAEALGQQCIQLFEPTAAAIALARNDGVSLTTDGVTPTLAGAVARARIVLGALGVDAETLGEIDWSPLGETAGRQANTAFESPIDADPMRLDPTFLVANALRAYHEEMSLLHLTLDQRLAPDHSRRTDMLAVQRLEAERRWSEVLDVVRQFAPAR